MTYKYSHDVCKCKSGSWLSIFGYLCVCFFLSRQLNLLCKIKWARNCRLQAATAGAVICRQIYRCCCDWINAECMKRQRHIQTAQTLQSRNSKVVSSICSAKISMSNLFYICMAKPTNFNIHAKLLWTAKNFKLDWKFRGAKRFTSRVENSFAFGKFGQNVQKLYSFILSYSK